MFDDLFDLLAEYPETKLAPMPSGIDEDVKPEAVVEMVEEIDSFRFEKNMEEELK